MRAPKESRRGGGREGIESDDYDLRTAGYEVEAGWLSIGHRLGAAFAYIREIVDT